MEDKNKANNGKVQQYVQEPSSDSDSESDSESKDKVEPSRPINFDSKDPDENYRDFMRALNSIKEEEEEEESGFVSYEERYNFPEDKEKWTEEDLTELWADGLKNDKTGWDPNWVDQRDETAVDWEIQAGRDPPIGPFYIPYRRHYPVIPDNHHDISNPKAAVEELDRIEEFMNWVSYIFEDSSSYEGTVFDDKAHGKGVFVAEDGLVRYEGEWLHNEMEGHGVVEVEIPQMQPIPGSRLEKKMRDRGQIITRDSMNPEDREWLEMDIEDGLEFADGLCQVPFYERNIWVYQFGEKPEKGRYRYAGQWKHGRMHGCGVYEVNERTIYGRFYFGEFLEQDTYGCDLEISAMHAGIAEVAAAKARMFTNKPDGMVREERGPYGDPQHPYLYEEEDVWMAPGFINQFFEVPDYWKMYVHEVDQEREMWLNSFYKAPLRLPMPAELEYWWANDEEQEFVLLNKEPEPDPEDPSKLIYTEDPLIIHTPTGRIIDYVDDEEHGIRLFWAPEVEEGEDDVDPDIDLGEDTKIDDSQFFPLGFDEFDGRVAGVKQEQITKSPVISEEKKDTELEKRVEENKKVAENKMALLKKELELAEAELALKEAIEDLDEALMVMQKVEEKKAEMDIQEEEEEKEQDASPSKPTEQFDEKTAEKKEDEDEEEEEDDGDDADAFSFGSVKNQDQGKNDQNGNKSGKSPPFGASSLPFATCSLVTQVPSKLLHSFMTWKNGKTIQHPSSAASVQFHGFSQEQWPPNSISFPNSNAKDCRLKAAGPNHFHGKRTHRLPMIVQSNKHIAWPKMKASQEINRPKGEGNLSILSLHSPLVE